MPGVRDELLHCVSIWVVMGRGLTTVLCIQTALNIRMSTEKRDHTHKINEMHDIYVFCAFKLFQMYVDRLQNAPAHANSTKQLFVRVLRAQTVSNVCISVAELRVCDA